MHVRISSSEVEIRRAAPGGGEESKRGCCLVLFCMSRRNARGQEPSEEGRCQGQGPGEQQWLYWSLMRMMWCWCRFAVGQQKCSAPKPKQTWALPALVMLLLVDSQASMQEKQFREVQQRSVMMLQRTIWGPCLLAKRPSNEGPEKPKVGENWMKQLVLLTPESYREHSSLEALTGNFHLSGIFLMCPTPSGWCLPFSPLWFSHHLCSDLPVQWQDALLQSVSIDTCPVNTPLLMSQFTNFFIVGTDKLSQSLSLIPSLLQVLMSLAKIFSPWILSSPEHLDKAALLDPASELLLWLGLGLAWPTSGVSCCHLELTLDSVTWWALGSLEMGK